MIPQKIFQDEKLPPMAKLLLGHLARIVAVKGPKSKDLRQQNLAADLGTTQARVSQILALLKEQKWVDLRHKNGGRNCSFRAINKLIFFPPLYDQTKSYTKYSEESEHINSRKTEKKNFSKHPFSIDPNLILSQVRRKRTAPTQISPAYRSNRWTRLFDQIQQLPNLPKHRVGSASWVRATGWLKRLIKTTAFFQDKDLPKDWLQQFGIRQKELTRQWTEADVLECFREVSQTYSPAYLPEDKSGLPRTIPDVLYNPRSRKSLFLKMHVHGAKSLANATNARRIGQLNRLNEAEAGAVKRLTRVVREAQSVPGHRMVLSLSQDESIRLHRIVKVLRRHYPRVKEAFPTVFHGFWDFVEDYGTWWLDQYGGCWPGLHLLGPGTKDWGRYLHNRGFNDDGEE
jgi:hypothetical protein